MPLRSEKHRASKYPFFVSRALNVLSWPGKRTGGSSFLMIPRVSWPHPQEEVQRGDFARCLCFALLNDFDAGRLERAAGIEYLALSRHDLKKRRIALAAVRLVVFSFRIMRERCTLTVFWERLRDTKVLI